MTSYSIDPLANPKGVKLLCELCQKPAFLQCSGCRVTYYCGTDHQKTDWKGIHEKICLLLIPLRTKIPFLPTEDERSQRNEEMAMKQREMIQLTLTTGQKLLFEGQHENAVPAAMQALRFAIDVHGLSSIELVPSYLILGEASIGVGRLGQAEEYLSQAQWTVRKTPECSNGIKSKLNRILGLLYSAKGEYDEALRYLADDIYFSSEDYGTDDINTSGGYYHMANIFYRQGRADIADSLYARVIDIWHEHLFHILQSSKQLAKASKGPLSKNKIEPENALNEAQVAEAVQVINSIKDFQVSQNTNPQAVTKVLLTTAMLNAVLGQRKQCDEYLWKTTESDPSKKYIDQEVMELLTLPLFM